MTAHEISAPYPVEHMIFLVEAGCCLVREASPRDANDSLFQCR